MNTLVHKTTVLISFFLFVFYLPAASTLLPSAWQPVSALAAESGKASWKQTWEELASAARKEGQLSVYSTASGGDVRKTTAAFTEKYGIKVDVLSARGPELVQKMDAQRRAGLYTVDIVIAGGNNLAFEMKPKGLLDKFDQILILPEVTDESKWWHGKLKYLDAERQTVLAFAGSPNYGTIGYNTSQMDPKEFISTMAYWRTFFTADKTVVGATDDDLRAISVPTLIIAGDDATHPLRVSEGLRDMMPRAEYHPPQWTKAESDALLADEAAYGLATADKLPPVLLAFLAKHAAVGV